MLHSVIRSKIQLSMTILRKFNKIIKNKDDVDARSY